MRTFLKILGGLALAFVLLAGLGAYGVYRQSVAHLRRTFSVAVTAPPVPADSAAIARGRHIAVTRGCLVCHGDDLAGAQVIDNPAMGRLHGPNLTQGAGGLPADYSDADYTRAIRHGVARDGRGLFLMPSSDYARMTDQDLGDLIAYLRSVPAVNRASVPLQLGPVARALVVAGKIKLAAEVIPHDTLKPEVVRPGPTAEYGRYLAAGCTGCHGSNFSGGKIDVGPPDWPPAANLTPHASGRLASWSEADFIRALRESKRPDGSALSPIMPKTFGLMDDTELKALWAYLKTLPPVPTGVR